MAWDNLSDAIFAHAAGDPMAPALVEDRIALSYGETATLVAKASVYLRDLGIGQGVRIGIALTNSIDHVILLFALFRVGAVPVELSPEDSGETLAATARKFGIHAIFTEPHVPAPPGIVQHRMMLSWRDDIARLSGDCRATASGDELDIIILTTGTTGVPGGIMWTQRQTAQRLAIRLAIYYPAPLSADFRARDLLLTAPMRYGWFFTCTLMQIVGGGRLIVMPNFAKPIELVRAIAPWKGAMCWATANMCRLFVAAAPAEGRLFPDLYLLESAGLPLFPWEKQAMTTRVAANFVETYGASGMGTISVLAGPDMVRKPESVGRPLPLLELEIVDDDGQPLPRDTFGRIRCRGPLRARLCPESVGDKRTEYFRDGWYYPGDVGKLDADGYLYLRGRAAEIIRRGAVEIFAADVEAAIASHPVVADAAVVGMPSQTRGEEVVAFVVTRGALAHDELARHCRERLAFEQRPDRVYYLDDLPRIAGGKVDRARLQSLALGEMVRQSSSS
jgi:acyl-coenzyme A synthetase/AMP-(fatty) acid ligase